MGGGEPGFREALALGSQFAERGSLAASLLESEGADALKGRLLALGLKASGAPLERANRILQLQGCASLSQVPKNLVAKPALKGIAFVRAGSEAGTDSAKSTIP